MAREAERGAAAERMAIMATGIGVLGIAGGIAVAALGAVQGGLPGLEGGWLGAVVAGAVLTLLGFGQVMRGLHLSATLDTLANVRLLQEETHRARTQAALHSHARREPMPELKPVAKMQEAPVPAAAATSAPLTRPKVVGANVAQMPTPAAATPRQCQSDRKASKAAPIVGKPFQPHPIFMARPPK